MPWYVYIVECNDQSLYTGTTTDIDRRVQEHNSTKKGARYTRMRQPVSLRYFEAHATRASACKREYHIKQLSREQKNALIRTHITS